MTTYETPEDRERQKTVAARFANNLGYEWDSMGPYSSFDIYLREDGHFAGIAEIKVRKTTDFRDRFSAIPLDIDKWLSLVTFEIATGKPAYFVVSYPDGIYWVRVGSLQVFDFEMRVSGRSDRPEAANDKRPFMQIPIDNFSLLDGAMEVKRG